MQARDIEAKAFPIARRGYEKSAVDAFLGQVANAFRALEEQAMAEAPPAPASPTFENLGSQVSTILATAAAAADEMKAEAGREIEATRRTLAEELESADQLQGAAQEEAAALLAAAREEADRIEQEALQKAATLEREANERAAMLERTTVANVEAMLAEGTKQYERLRDVREKTADRLASIESMIRKAREECSDEVARGAFKAARKAVKGAKPDNGAAVEAKTAPDGQKTTRAAAGRRAATTAPTARTARSSRTRQG